ncbi:MAG: LapA family protein, partial [Burkholderiales bacterium]|nr:LapA family protein [Burkholderiales bacterium]
MRILSWLLRALVFFTLFAFALNNQDPVVVHWFFGIDWQAPLVIVVLLAFGAGCALGVLAMLPPWWRARRQAAQAGAVAGGPGVPAGQDTTPASGR